MVEQHFTAEELSTEEWRDVPDYPAYEVSSLGRVRRKTDSATSRGGRMLGHIDRTGGYISLSLSRDGRAKHMSMHRIVAAAFIGPCPPDKQVNHKDGDKQNNRPGNLEYLTPLENMRHAVQIIDTFIPTRARGDKHGARTKPESLHRGADHWANKSPARRVRGERHGNAKLTENAVHAMRAEFARGATRKELALRYGVSEATVRLIVRGKLWAHVV